MFQLFLHKNVLSYLSRSGRSEKSTGDSKTRTRQPKRSTQISSFYKKLTIFLWTQVYKLASRSTYSTIQWIWRSQRGKELPKIENFSVYAGDILCCLYQRFWNMNNIISFNSQQGEVHNERATMFRDGTNENHEEDNIIISQQVEIPGRHLSSLYYQMW